MFEVARLVHSAGPSVSEYCRRINKGVGSTATILFSIALQK